MTCKGPPGRLFSAVSAKAEIELDDGDEDDVDEDAAVISGTVDGLLISISQTDSIRLLGVSVDSVALDDLFG
ncbi:MAG: hypothetical protein ACFB22_15525 [Rhodothalassiaceae bacterium]